MRPELEDFLVTRHHVLTTAEAERLGFSREVLRGLVRRKVLVRVARGAYVQASVLAALPTPTARHLLRARAVLRTRPEQWAASHVTAAVVWGLPVLHTALDRIHLTHTEAVGSARRYGEVTVHTCPGPGLITSRDGMSTVSPEAAVIGTGLLGSVTSGVMAADAALRKELITPRSLRETLDSYRRVPGVAAARTVVDLADGRSESPGESWLRLILRDLGFHAVPQFVVRAGRQVVARVDFYLPELGVVLEFDGMLKYKAEPGAAPGAVSQVVIAERARERRIRGLGYGVGRVVWGELRHPAAVRREIEDASATARLDLIAARSNGAPDLAVAGG
ncbi:type IV toxin-antitoxin system AbiEi family antitoxin domain-containing protein [Ornithinimicrobium flavum]|uniref:type IV toxin-antitoxin system AbiEi family antitoxin domain-containing protein n=1 Tax=Ornithinimicrobium flavum TaxID=1288636 RepID=UPI0013051EB2|nr:type IV toxin-antitoxin system AbiEi family antitoxin domain-containing protein [Ornithinimicrobium flavum]